MAEVFVRTGRIMEVHVGGRLIRTTAEHPFFVNEKGWLPAGDLEVDDLFLSHDGHWLAVEGLQDTGADETVYNLRIADYHAYFVGSRAWGFSAWAHNADYDISTANADSPAAVNSIKEYARRVNAWLGANGPQTVQSTAGSLRKQANAAARAERLAAARVGTPYSGVARHVPDTAISGLANPPEWLDMAGNSNSIAGGGLRNWATIT